MSSATGETIRQLRESAGLGRRELAQAAQISQVFVNKLEQGERHPSPQTLTKIATALGLTVRDLAAKIAVFEASTAPTNDEMHRRLLRAAAISGGAAVLAAAPLVPAGIAVTLTGLAAAGLARRRQQAAHDANDGPWPDVDDVRRELSTRIQVMSADQLVLLAALIQEIWPDPASTGPRLLDDTGGRQEHEIRA